MSDDVTEKQGPSGSLFFVNSTTSTGQIKTFTAANEHMTQYVLMCRKISWLYFWIIQIW
jgi:hypothetical protein